MEGHLECGAGHESGAALNGTHAYGPGLRPGQGQAPGRSDGPGPTVLVIAKEPVAGRVKTRLTPPHSPGDAALLAEAALADTLATVRLLPVRRRVLVLSGQPGRWLPDGFEVVPQSDGGLDERIAAAFALCDGPALLIGMDTPQITPALLSPVTGANSAHGDSGASGGPDSRDAWFGPAADGGFWALGMARPDPALVRGVPMSTDSTGAVQRQRLVDAGMSVRDLPVLRDVDDADDAAEVAELSHGRFASVHANLARTVSR